MKITTGHGYDNSKLSLKLDVLRDSSLEVTIGEGHGMSVREISLIERESPDLMAGIREMQDAVRMLPDTDRRGDAGKALAEEAANVAQKAERILVERKWYSV